MPIRAALCVAVCAAVFGAAPVLAADLPAAAPAAVGMSADKLSAVTQGLNDRVAAGDIAGAVAMAARDGKVFYSAAVGQRDIAAGAPMRPDTLFRIYSMTRPMTAAAILMLQDDGRLRVSDPVSKYLPAFAGQKVLNDPNGVDPAQSRARRGDITIANLLTHTSGVGDRASKYYVGQKVRAWDMTSAQVVGNYAAVPLFDDPGTAFRYGESAEVLGRVIEVVSGMPLDQFLQRRLFGPLSMTDTVFFVDPARAPRLAALYRKGEDGELAAFENEPIPVTQRRALISGGVGLVSTGPDLLKFAQLVLDGGAANGKRLLSPAAAQAMRTDAIPAALKPIGKTGYMAGSGWTLGGLAIVDDPSKYDHTVDRGEVWWDGSVGTRFWIDPAEGMVSVVLAQAAPAGGGGFRETFKTRLYDAILQRRAPAGARP
jgi:CubicO group peptidase (beta-lactamase class C family)